MSFLINCDFIAQYFAGTPMIVGVDATYWKFYSNGVFIQCANRKLYYKN